MESPIELPAPRPTEPLPGQKAAEEEERRRAEKAASGGGFQVGKAMGLEDFILPYASGGLGRSWGCSGRGGRGLGLLGGRGEPALLLSRERLHRLVAPADPLPACLADDED